jgi:amiloride-sensitive sodium channel
MLDSDEIYKPIVHEDLSFNIPHNSTKIEWSLEKGYPTADIDILPRRVLGSGAKAGLNIVLGLFETDLEYLCRGPVQGFKILLHTPGEIPRVSKHYFRVPLHQEVLVSVKPQIITTAGNLDQYHYNRRQCYFNHEKQLKYFKIDTQSNCELECLANFTRQECGCVKFSMPSKF